MPVSLVLHSFYSLPTPVVCIAWDDEHDCDLLLRYSEALYHACCRVVPRSIENLSRRMYLSTITDSDRSIVGMKVAIPSPDIFAEKVKGMPMKRGGKVIIFDLLL